MLPAPARIAAAPSPKSRACWNPAVPPPPVGGAAVGNGLGVGGGVGGGVGVGVAEADGDGEALADGLAEALAEALADALADAEEVAVGAAAGPVLLGAGVDVVGAGEPGEDVVGSSAEGEDDVQAEMSTDASTATMPQPTALSLAARPARAVLRTFMEPPAPGSLPASAEGRSPKAPRTIKVKPATTQTWNGLFPTEISDYVSTSRCGRRGEGRRQ